MSILSEFCDKACDCCTPLFFICRSQITSSGYNANIIIPKWCKLYLMPFHPVYQANIALYCCWRQHLHYFLTFLFPTFSIFLFFFLLCSAIAIEWHVFFLLYWHLVKMITTTLYVQNSGCSFWPFVDIDTITHFVVSNLSMLLLPKYVHC